MLESQSGASAHGAVRTAYCVQSSAAEAVVDRDDPVEEANPPEILRDAINGLLWH